MYTPEIADEIESLIHRTGFRYHRIQDGEEFTVKVPTQTILTPPHSR